MRLVHHQNRGQALKAAVDDEVAELEQKLALVLVCRRQAEIARNVLQKFHRRKAAVENVGVGDIIISLEQLQQTAQQQGFAGADLAGKYHESLVPTHSVVKRGQRLVVLFRREEKRGVGSDLKRIPRQLVKGLVHSGKPIPANN